MNSLLDIAWLIPASPLFGASFIGLLLVIFNRTINRLTKPVSFLLINCIGLSTLLSIIFYLKNLSGDVFSLHIHIATFDFIERFSLNIKSSIFLCIIGVIFFTINLISYYKLNRSSGYVMYLVLLSFACGFFFLLALDNDLSSKLFSGFYA